jgi:transcriptional regulator GlxA family with amidase domain
VPVEAASGIEPFLRDPVGRYVVGRHFFIWCHALDFTGSVLWGRPEERDTMEIAAIWRELHSRMHSFDVVTDGSRIESIDAAAFDVMIKYLRDKLPTYARTIRRQAIVHPPGLPGAAIAGLLPTIGLYYQWRIFAEPRAGFDWLARGDGASVCEQVTTLAERTTGVSPWRRILGELLRDTPDDVTLAAAARRLGRSERSLQRDLHQAGTTFRGELEATRVELARALLVDTDLKIDSVARKVGCASAAHFATLFRRVSGETPSAYRERHRR